MKHVIKVMPFTYNKIAEGSKKLDVRLFDKQIQQIRLNDIIEYVNVEKDVKILCVVRGIAIFENFDMLIDTIPPQLVGYDDKEEIRVRVNRAYTKEQQKDCFACGLFISELDTSFFDKFKYLER